MEELVMECNKNKLIALLISIVVTACTRWDNNDWPYIFELCKS